MHIATLCMWLAIDLSHEILHSLIESENTDEYDAYLAYKNWY